MSDHRLITTRRGILLIVAGWVAVVLLFAIQWYVYDAARGDVDRFRYYLWWSCYTWGVLTPLVAIFAYRHPINTATWKRALPLHLVTSVGLIAIEISAEAMLGKLRLHHDLSVREALRHYFTRHTQVSLLTYWMLVGAVQLYQMHEEARKRELRSSKLEARLSAAQLEVLRAQIHPHFLFNTLQAATTLIYEDPEGAEDVLLRLSELLRVSIDESHVQEVPLQRELEMLDLYVGIQSRRFGDRLQFVVSVDKNVLNCMVPALVLQPLVENAVHHGIGRNKGSDTVTIRGSQEGEFLRLEVFNLNSQLGTAESMRNGVGLTNTRARLEQLYGNRQELRLYRLEPSGVCTGIRMPLRSAPVQPEGRCDEHSSINRR